MKGKMKEEEEGCERCQVWHLFRMHSTRNVKMKKTQCCMYVLRVACVEVVVVHIEHIHFC